MGSRKLEKISVDEKLCNFMRQHGRGLLGLLVLLLVVHDIFGAHGFIAMRRTQTEIQKVKSDLHQLNKENAELTQQVRDLKTDPATIEAMGRGMGLARPGEVIIKIPDSQISPAIAASARH
jgi:cell division protein FtsB